MFLYPNKKAMEVVLHFLFCTLDAPLAFQEFRYSIEVTSLACLALQREIFQQTV